MIPTRLPALTRLILTFFVMVFSCAFAAVPARAPSVAVLDFTARGVSTELANSVADRLSHALRDSGTFRVLDRNRVSSWRDLSRGGGYLARCDQWDCAIRAGRVMQVDRVVIGSVGMESGDLVLSAQLLDVYREEVLKKVNFRSNQGEDDLLERGTFTVSAEFTGKGDRRDSSRVGKVPVAAVHPAWSTQQAILAENRRVWATTAAVTSIVGVVPIVAGIAQAFRDGFGCAMENAYSSGNEEPRPPCPRPNETTSKVLIGIGVGLEVVAFASAITAAQHGIKLKSLQKSRTIELTWAPRIEPATGALGLATRLEF